MEARFVPSASFMRLPEGRDLGKAGAAVVGLPFDCGTHPARLGARMGPSAIRQQSHALEYGDEWSDVDAFATLRAIDAGDVAVVHGDFDRSFAAIEAAIHEIASSGAIPVSLGGDGSVALPQMRALKRVHPDLVTLHIDSHTDAWPLPQAANAIPFTLAAEEGLVDTRRSYQVGMRGNASTPRVLGFGRGLGYNVIPMRDLFARGIEQTFAEIADTIGRRPVYLCYDMDFFDPSAAPGVCTPTPGGASAREGLAVLEACAGLDIVAVDVNTVSPLYDPGGVTALLAANLVLNAFNLLARAKVG